MKCPNCYDEQRGYNTGEKGQCGMLDCSDCDTAIERDGLNKAMKEAMLSTGMIRQDEHFHAYQLGKVAAIAELLPMLSKMWGYAIELGETNYFDDPQFGKADWSSDCHAATKLIADLRKQIKS